MISKQFLNSINAIENYSTKRFLLACSGGVDSMVLAHLCHINGLSFELAHLNYNLRGDDSLLDESLVADFAKRINAKVHVKSIDTNALVANSKESIQMLARRVRYEWFQEIKLEYNIDILFTAHHQNDAIESFFLNLLRGTGIKGLRGITNQKDIYRPLIQCEKRELYAYASEHQIPFREDESNASIKYERNWLRHELLPIIRNRVPELDKIMIKNMSNLNEDYQIIEKAIQNDLENAGISLGAKHIGFESVQKLQFKKRSLTMVLEEFGFNLDVVSNVLQSIELKRTGAVFYSEDFQLLVDREALVIHPIQKIEKDNEWIIEKKNVRFSDPIQIQFEIQEKWELEKTPNVLQFDAHQLKFPLKLRYWKEGDKMKLFGMNATKKVSDILIDNKVNRIDKARVLILENEQGILSVLGLKRSSIAVINSQTKKVFKISIGDE